MKVLFDIREAAEALSIGRSKLYQILDDGMIQSVKIGQRRLIPAKAIDEYVATLMGEARNG